MTASQHAAPAPSSAPWFVAMRQDVLAALLVVLVAAGVRVAFFPGLPVLVHGDSYQYYRPAADLATGEGFDLPLKRPPLYPAFMALVWVAFGEDPLNTVAAQHGLGVLTALLAFGIGRLTFGRSVGLLAGLASAVAGGVLVYEHYLLSEALFSFLLTLGVFLYVLGLKRGGLWWYAGAGLAVGLATLTRVHAQILVVAAPVVALLCCRSWRQEVRGTLVAAAVAGAVLVPWMARNQAVHGELTVAGRAGQSLTYRTLVHNPGAFVFYDRENPPVDEDDNLERTRRYMQRQADTKVRNPSANVLGINIHAWLMRELEIGESEANRLMQRAAMDAIRDRPLTYLGIVLEDTARIFFAEPETFAHHVNGHQDSLQDRTNLPPKPLRSWLGPLSPEQERAYPTTERLASLYQSTWLGPVVPGLALLGLIVAARTPAWRPALAPGLAVMLLHTASLAVIGFSERYRQPTEPLVHVLAFGGLLVLARLAYARLGRHDAERAEATPAPGRAGVGAAAH